MSTKVCLYVQQYLNFDIETQRYYVRRFADMTSKSPQPSAFAINLHEPVFPNLPIPKRIADSSPWKLVGGRYDMTRPKHRIGKALRSAARICYRRGSKRLVLYGPMGPDTARRHPQYEKLRTGTNLVTYEHCRTVSGPYRDGFLDYIAWALEQIINVPIQKGETVWARGELAEVLSKGRSPDGRQSYDVRMPDGTELTVRNVSRSVYPVVIDSVEGAIHLSRGNWVDALRRVVKDVHPQIDVLENVHGNPLIIREGQEGHGSLLGSEDSQGTGGWFVEDGWGRSQRSPRPKWPNSVGANRPYAGLTDGWTPDEVADNFVSRLRSSSNKGRDYYGILLTPSWGATSHSEAVAFLNGLGPWKGVADPTTPPWERVIRKVSRVAGRL